MGNDLLEKKIDANTNKNLEQQEVLNFIKSEKNLQELGLKLNPEDLKLVTQRIIELGDKKETVTKEDLPYIISDVLDSQSYEVNLMLL